MVVMIRIIIIIIIANRPACKLLIARLTDQGSTIEHLYAYAGALSSSSLVVNHHAHAYIIPSNPRSQIANQETHIKGCHHSTRAANTATLVA